MDEEPEYFFGKTADKRIDRIVLTLIICLVLVVAVITQL